MFRMVAFAGIFALTAMFAGSAKAQFPDGAKVMIKYPGWNPGTPSITLKKEGADKAGGIYTIQVEGQNKYLMAKDSEEGTTVGLSKPDEKVTPTKWILHKHGEPFQIMHAANGANAISVNKDKNGLVLRRNQGDELQRIVIQEIRSRNLGGGLDVKWTNKTGVPITVNWIDTEGKEMPSDKIIKPNEVFDGSTFLGHVFRVRDEKRAEIYLIEVEKTSAMVDIKGTISFKETYEGLAGSYKEKSGGEMTIRKSDDSKKEAGPWRFVLKGEGDWACSQGEDNPGKGMPSTFFIKFAEGPFKGEQYNIVRDKDGKMKELQLAGGSKAIWVKQ